MSVSRSGARGLTMIELLVTLAIVAFLVLASVPSFTGALLNTRIRGTAENILTGIQTAKSEAVARNVRVRFQLTSTMDNSCVLATNAGNWVINVDAAANAALVEGNCDVAPDDQAAPFILQSRPAAADAGSVVIAATQASLVFNGLGRLADVPAGNVVIDMTSPAGGACAADGGDVTCLRIVVSPIGQARMCNPARAAGDPQAC